MWKRTLTENDHMFLKDGGGQEKDKEFALHLLMISFRNTEEKMKILDVFNQYNRHCFYPGKYRQKWVLVSEASKANENVCFENPIHHLTHIRVSSDDKNQGQQRNYISFSIIGNLYSLKLALKYQELFVDSKGSMRLDYQSNFKWVRYESVISIDNDWDGKIDGFYEARKENRIAARRKTKLV